MERNQEMSPLARQRMAAMLPEMLGAVRWRRRRRHIVNGSVLAVAAVLLIGYWPTDDRSLSPVGPMVSGPMVSGPMVGGPGAGAAQQSGDQQSGARTTVVCEVFGDLPGVVDRYRATGGSYTEWFVGDEELQSFLREAQRPHGIVRVSGKVTVTAAALDPFPVMSDE